MEEETNLPLPQVEQIKQPTFSDPLKLMSQDIKTKTGDIPPTQQQTQGSGLGDLFSNATAQLDQVNNQGFAFKNFDVGIDEAFTTLNSGDSVRKFESFERFVNNEDRLAKQQSTGEKWANGLSKFGIKTGTAVLGYYRYNRRNHQWCEPRKF